MPEIQAKLSSNLIGKLLGKGSIYVNNDLLIILKNKTTNSLRECSGFATLHNGMFGQILRLNMGGKPISYRFLQKNGSDDFLVVLNRNITELISDSISRIFDEFHYYVVNEYPRDSRMAEISALCATLNERYSAQTELWNRYLAPQTVQKVKEIISYHPVQPGVLRAYHEKFQLEKRHAFFDRVESNPLTLEQRLGVLRSNDRNMVLAAAGTGKTSVIVAKALDLIDRGLASPAEILVLAYNRKAAEELRERLVNKAQSSHIHLESLPQISTFHALGLQILRQAGVSTFLSDFTEDEIKFKQWVTLWLEEYLESNSSRLLNFISMFSQEVNPFDFETEAEYERYVRDNEFRTLRGEKVRGYQELLIANFLYMNGVDYIYEAPYQSKRRIDIGFDYRPDFYIKDRNIYIEHFGIDRKGNTRSDIDSVKYNESISKKRELHTEYQTSLIETFHYEWLEGTLISNLEIKMLSHGIIFEPIKPEEILQKLREQGCISDWSNLLKKALQAIRTERLTHELIISRFYQAGIKQSQDIAQLLDELHQGYIQELKNQNAIDFDDMIIRTIQVIDDNHFVPNWRYILVDEFQDISTARMELIRALIANGPTPSLTVVGDDWQSIYRFSGGKLELTTRFSEMVGSYTLTKLQKTFRYNNSIANTAGTFIMENPEQYKKQIETHTFVGSSQIYLLDDKPEKKNGLYERVKDVVDKIRENDASGRIAIIARYNYLLHESKNALGFSRQQKNIHFWTFHKSKGLEADYCILIGFFQGSKGFPNENTEGAIIEALLPSLDAYPHSEERRLLYVGITRAKKKLYIIADATAPSSFITELLAPKYDINIVSEKFKVKYRVIFKCPHCKEGYLTMMEGRYGEYYRCSSGYGCPVGKARVCSVCRSPSIDTRYASTCQNPSCSHAINICEKCGRPMKLRQGKNGQFWGCSGYGLKQDQCKNTLKN